MTANWRRSYADRPSPPAGSTTTNNPPWGLWDRTGGDARGRGQQRVRGLAGRRTRCDGDADRPQFLLLRGRPPASRRVDLPGQGRAVRVHTLGRLDAGFEALPDRG